MQAVREVWECRVIEFSSPALEEAEAVLAPQGAELFVLLERVEVEELLVL